MDLIIYTDGNYSSKTNKSAYAFVIIDEKRNIIYKNSGVSGNKGGINQVTGELLAVLKAIDYLISVECADSSVIIYSDYNGVSNWLNYKWKIKSIEVKNIVKRIRNLVDKLKDIGTSVEFRYIPRGTDEMNVLADKMCGELN